MPALAGVLAAGPPAMGGNGYHADHWDTSEGLPARQVRDLLQTPDGYLWVATPAGLVRFDGHRFTVLDSGNTPGFPNETVQALYWSRAGELWFAGEGYLRALRDGEARLVDEVSGLVHAMAEDPEGRLWLLKDEGRLCVREDGGWVDLDEPGAGFLIDDRGDLLVRLADGTMARAGDGALERLATSQVPAESPLWVLRRNVLAQPSSRRALVARAHEGGLLVDGAGGETYAVPAGLPWLQDRRGVLWVTRDSGLEAYRPGSATPVFRQDLDPGTLISAVREDREGNLWFGTRARGLFRLRRNLFERYEADGAQVFRRFFRRDEGEILVSSAQGVHELRGSLLVPFRPLADLGPVRALHRDPSGTDWLAGREWLVVRPPGEPEHVMSIPGVEIIGFLDPPGRPGVVWAWDRERLYELRRDRSGNPLPLRVLHADRVTRPRVVFADRETRVWIATLDGLHRLDGDRLETLGPADGFPDVDIRSLHQTDDGAVWLGTVGNGLLRVRDGQVRSVGTATGLGEDYVYALLEDHRGSFWMSGSRGVHRVAVAELDELFRGERTTVNGVHYGDESGLLNPEEYGDLGYAGPDGRLWFSTHRGIVSVDPDQVLALTSEPPLVHVERVLVDGTTPAAARGLPQPGPVVLTPGQRSFTVEYTGISLRDPGQVTFQYRLDGVDPGWIHAGASRTARYTHVPPGIHTFRVRALSAGSVWSAGEARMTIEARPYLHETTWFRLALVAMLAALATLAYRARVRRLQRHSAELDHTVQERTRDLAVERDRAEEALSRVEEARQTVEAQARRLRELDSVKSRFFANVSHEFRTPLTLMIGPLEDLLDGMHGPLEQAPRESIELAARNAHRLLLLVNQLLDASRLESGRLQLAAREEDLGRFLRRLADNFTPLAERRGTTFQIRTPETPVMIWFDAEQMEKVLVNLLANAFKFTPADGSITLEMDEPAGDPEAVEVRVRDSGPGIPAAHLPHVFDRFYQVDDSPTRSQPGTGIGLALAKELVDLHHGVLDVDSTVGEGTTFRLRLPTGNAHLRPEEIASEPVDPRQARLARAARAASRRRLVMNETPAGEAGAGRPKPAPDAAAETDDDRDEDRTVVLVVDDHPDVRHYLRTHLEERYRVREANNGRAALEAARRDPPDLIVADVMMPEMDGLELCRAVKSDPELDFVPVILLTARASEESKVGGLEIGADDYLTKPFSVRELAARVDNLIAQRRRLRERFASGEERAAGAPGMPTVQATPGASPDDRAFLARFTGVVRDALGDEDLNIDGLAQELGLSRRTLYRRLETVAGETPSALMAGIRLDEAARLLADGAGNVSEVAYAVGFRSVSHFSRKFRERHGCSPSSWRARPAG